MQFKLLMHNIMYYNSHIIKYYDVRVYNYHF